MSRHDYIRGWNDYNWNTGPRVVRSGGIIKFGRYKYQHDKLIPFSGGKVYVWAMDLWDGCDVRVFTVEYVYSFKKRKPVPVAGQRICEIEEPIRARI